MTPSAHRCSHHRWAQQPRHYHGRAITSSSVCGYVSASSALMWHLGIKMAAKCYDEDGANNDRMIGQSGERVSERQGSRPLGQCWLSSLEVSSFEIKSVYLLWQIGSAITSVWANVGLCIACDRGEGIFNLSLLRPLTYELIGTSTATTMAAFD